MNEELPFVRALHTAYKASDRHHALAKAFAELHEATQEQGDGRFKAFMNEAYLCRLPSLCLQGEGSVPFETADPAEWTTGWRIQSVTPGYYRLFTTTGRVLWQEELSARDLIWAHATQMEALKAAADTGGADLNYTRRFSLFAGEITITVYPGVTSGTIGVNEQP